MELEKPIVIAIVAVILSVAAIASSIALSPAPFTLDDGAVTAAKIADDAVDNTKLADNAVTENDIADGAVTGPKIASGAVDSTTLANNAVTEDDIADGAVTGSKIASGAVTSAEIYNYTITNADIKSTANIAGSKLLDNSVTTAKLEDSAVTAAKMAIKIQDGKDNVSGASTTITFSFPGVPTVVATLADKVITTDENIVISITTVTADNFTVRLRINGAEATAPGENIYWIAIYTP